MNIRNYINKIFCLGLGAIVFLNSSGCLNRVPVPLQNTQEVERYDVIYVMLKSGIEYKVKNPIFGNEYLIGSTQNKKIDILINDIKTIYVIRQDKKKIIIGHIVAILAITSFIVFFVPRGLTLD